MRTWRSATKRTTSTASAGVEDHNHIADGAGPPAAELVTASLMSTPRGDRTRWAARVTAEDRM